MRGRRKIVRKERDQQQRREEARRFASKVSRTILAVAAVLTLIVVANRWGAEERLRSVRIVGRLVLDSAEIMERGRIEPGATMRSLDLNAIENRLATNPFLSRVVVYRESAGRLVVEVVERTPEALCLLNGEPVYLDSQAVSLPYRFSRATFDVPVIRGIERSPDSVQAEATLDSALTLEALGIVHILRAFDEGLYRQISEITRDERGEYRFSLADGGLNVLAGAAREIPGRLPKLDLFMRTALAAHPGARPVYVDLRWKGQVVVRWS